MPREGQLPFIPKLQGHIAEFLQGGSLKRLSLLDLSTCVGLGYGFLLYLFSWKIFSNRLPDLCRIKYQCNFNLILPISEDFGLNLRDRLTLLGLTYSRNPWTYGELSFI